MSTVADVQIKLTHVAQAIADNHAKWLSVQDDHINKIQNIQAWRRGNNASRRLLAEYRNEAAALEVAEQVFRKALNDIDAEHERLYAVQDKAVSDLHALRFNAEASAPIPGVIRRGQVKCVAPNAADHLYLMRNAQGLLKIGRSKHPQKRCRQISAASGIPTEIVAVVLGGGHLEPNLHARFAQMRVCGEWFAYSMDIVKVITALVE